MRDRPAGVPNKWLAVVPVLIATALPLWQIQLEYGWVQMAFGRFAWLYWTLTLIWTVLVAAAIRGYRWWWLLITAPFVLFPIFMVGVVLVACSGGNCI